jgi:signal transduction histidine kinase
VKSPPPAPVSQAARFRTRVLVAMTLVISVTTVAALAWARRSVATDERRNFAREFEAALTSLHQVQQVRHAALVERCRALARRSRIHAALEDEALDLLYLSAGDELRDVVAPRNSSEATSGYSLHARFYRFLDSHGRIISPEGEQAGVLNAATESQLALPEVPGGPQLGYLTIGAGESLVLELIAMPIVSSETQEPIAALVLGFPPVLLDPTQFAVQIVSGIWTAQQLHLAALPPEAQQRLHGEVAAKMAEQGAPEGSFETELAGSPCMLFYKRLNPGSLYPPAYEVCVFPLEEMIARQRRLGWQITGVGAALVLGGFVVSQAVSRRLSLPVAKLEHDSEEHRSQRERVEAALESTSVELQRAARFSADASHQLKTPVTVLRAGLEELLAKASLKPHECQEVSALIHQTYRLSSIIEDLLLLSRIDAGRLQIQFGPVNLSALIEASLDDLSASPGGEDLVVETQFPPGLMISGEKRYVTLILQNLLENARKYNRPGGRIRLVAREQDGEVVLVLANTALRPIPLEAQVHVFERFHRGSVGENIPGYGLGLNLSRELARIHGGDVRLLRSDATWTELEVRFRAALMVGPNLDQHRKDGG